MRRAALIYNPASGQRPGRRAKVIAEVVSILRAANVEVKVIATESPASAGMQAHAAMEEGYDTILACGGDGTVHESLQQLVGGTAALGVIPMGTANALAADLGMPGSPIKAVKRLLTAKPERISVGQVFFQDGDGETRSRYFIVAAGVGADALFMGRLDPKMKQRFGYALYVVEAFRLWVTHKYPMFAAAFQENGNATWRVEVASQILAVRIRNFGGALHDLAPGAAITNPKLHVIALTTRSRVRYLRFMVAVLLGRHKYVAPIQLVECESVECYGLAGAREELFVEADGEWLGTLPVRMEVVPNSLTVLIPTKDA